MTILRQLSKHKSMGKLFGHRYYYSFGLQAFGSMTLAFNGWGQWEEGFTVSRMSEAEPW